MKKLLLLLLPFMVIGCTNNAQTNSGKKTQPTIKTYYDNVEAYFVPEYCYYKASSREYDKEWIISVDDTYYSMRFNPNIFTRVYEFTDSSVKLFIFRSMY